MVLNKICFVFGSNLRGRHGKGAAKEALDNWGARMGRWEGHNGRSYAIPTKDRQLRTLSLESIRFAVERFKVFARNNPDIQFLVTPIGTGLAGYRYDDIAPMFEGTGSNVHLPDSFITACEGTHKSQLPGSICGNVELSTTTENINDRLQLTGDKTKTSDKSTVGSKIITLREFN